MDFLSSKSREWLIQYGIVKKVLFGLLFVYSSLFITTDTVSARAPDCTDPNVISGGANSIIWSTPIPSDIYSGQAAELLPIQVTIKNLSTEVNDGSGYRLEAKYDDPANFDDTIQPHIPHDNESPLLPIPYASDSSLGELTFTLNEASWFKKYDQKGEIDEFYILLLKNREELCTLATYLVHTETESLDCNISLIQDQNGNEATTCFVPGEVTWNITNFEDQYSHTPVNTSKNLAGISSTQIAYSHTKTGLPDLSYDYINVSNGLASGTLNIDSGLVGDNFQFKVITNNIPVCDVSYPVTSGCDEASRNNGDDGTGDDASNNSNSPYFICQQIPNSQERSACESCVKQEEITNEKGEVVSAGSVSGLWTAVGCIKTDSTSILRTFITIGLSLGGSVALIMILVAGFMFSTSQGDAKRTGEAKEMLTSAIIGLLFIIFSVTILQFIGVTLLRIPGFGGI